MKKSKVFLFTLLTALIANFSLLANPTVINPTEIRNEISKFVESIDLTDMDADEVRVTFQFIVNAKNQIIILDVDNEEFDHLLKCKLNYKTLKTNEVEINKVITLPIVFQKS